MSDAGKAVHAIRTAAEISVAELARVSDLDTALIERLEAGDEKGISTADVARIARVLRVDPIDLMTGAAIAASSPAVFFRQAAYPDFHDTDRVELMDALERGHALVAVNRSLGRGIGLRAQFTSLPVGPKPWDDGYRLAAEVRAAIGNPDRAIDDIRQLIEDRFEVEVLVGRFRAQRIQAVSVKQEPAAAIILLNQANAGYRNSLRRRVDVAHELAHVLFDEPAGGIRIAIDSGADVNRHPAESGHPPEEQRANAFAAELLMPLHGLGRLFGSPKPAKGASSYADALARVQRAREEFKTPKEVAVNHLCWRGYVDQGLRDALLKQNYPSAGPARERWMRRSLLERRVRLALRKGEITALRARELLGLSVWDDFPGVSDD